MISKSEIKLIHSLTIKKLRIKHQLFVAETDKLITDLLSTSYQFEKIFFTEETNPEIIRQIKAKNIPFSQISKSELQKVSFLQTPQNLLALVKTKMEDFDETKLHNQFILALDSVQDPGNFGTILRLANWFGINHILCSIETVDLYNPKVIQSTMGAFHSIRIKYCDLEQSFSRLNQASIPIFGAFMEGNNIYTHKTPSKGVIVMGNEGKGISRKLHPYINQKISIPSFQEDALRTESLNVAMSTAIICSEFMRKKHFS